jgi:HEPN domain-containing protein
MKPTTLEWIDKAEGDFAIAQMSYRARKNPNYDAACFHAQQCAEKYLKARLEEAGLAVPKTHNLYALLTLVLPIEPTWNVLAADLNVLSAFAVAYRYPGISATRIDANDAIRRCRRARSVVRQTFGLPVK